MRTFRGLLAMLLLSATGLFAQEPPKPPARTEEPAAAPTQAQSAPKLGHPLDPADVDVLTGKSKRASSDAYQAPAISPYGYGGYGGYGGFGPYSLGASRFGGSQFASVGGSAQPLFAPIAFGRVGNRSFFVIGNTSSFGAPFFFFGRSHARPIGLFPLAGPRLSRIPARVR